MFENKKILVTGGAGMIGRQLINILLEKKAEVHLADISDSCDLENVIYHKTDLREYSNCKKICKDIDYVFNLVGIKASPKACIEQPANIIGPMLQFNTNMLEAAMHSEVEWYLYTSSVGVYQPAPVLKEDYLWLTVPSKNDWYGGWAKRMGELQIEAYEKQNGFSKCSIIRPSNVYGPYDNFDLNSAMVIPSLIRKADENDVLEVWGNGEQIRDFIHAKDVARAMIFAVENKITTPLNAGSGKGVTIKNVAEIVAEKFNKKIMWDHDKPSGDPIRLFDTKKIENLGYQHSIDIKTGILDTIDWYLNNKEKLRKKYQILK